MESTDLRFLVVDDEQFVRNLAVRLLKRLNHHYVATASDGHEALAFLGAVTEPVDIVICDLNMPGMDGVEFVRHVSTESFAGGIIYFSGEDERLLETATDLARSRGIQVLGSILKPLTPDGLASLIRQYQPNVAVPTARPAQASISENELREGLTGDNLQLVYQPKIAVASGEILGVETLARWQHQDRGVLAPPAFIPVAERCGLINDLTYRIIADAMAQTGSWLEDGIRLKVSVNVSVNTFTLDGFAGFLLDTVESQGVNPSNVVLEVTETQLMENASNCLEVLMQLRLKRFGLSIDDFGTGHSSLEQLRRIPFTELKIDRAYVHAAEQNKTARTILESSVDLGKRLGMEIVAEGAENREDWDLVESLGCHWVQGFYCARPMSSEALQDFIGGWTGPHQ